MIRFTVLILGLTWITLHANAQNDPTEKKLKRPLAELPLIPATAVGINPDSIQHLLTLIRTTPPSDFRGLVVLKEGKLVVEEYFNTYWRETIHDIRSAGKSITALLLGIALDKGLIKSEEQSLSEFFPQAKGLKADIKIKHLLMMSSGLAADDDDPNSPGNSSRWLTEPDWVGFALSLPMAFKPGEKFVYNDLSPMLAGAIIEQVSGRKLADFAREYLFTPLGINEFYWYTGVSGHTAPMGNLYLSTLDLAKLGQLMLNKGSWHGQSLIRSDWISRVGQQQFALSDRYAQGYGYYWYRSSMSIGRTTYNYLFASGNGGNLLFVVPQADLVVSLTSSAYGQGYSHQRSHTIFELVLKALIDR